MPELALDHDQRDPLARHLDRMRMPQLVWRESAPNTGRPGGVMELAADAGGGARPPARRTAQNAEQRPGGSDARTSSHGSSCAQAQRSIPTSRRLSPLPCRMRTAPRSGSRSVSLSERASLTRGLRARASRPGRVAAARPDRRRLRASACASADARRYS
jgi:hypothetical protein